MKILVVYHSVNGNTKEMASAVAEGVELIEGADCILKSVNEVTEQDFLSADGIIAGSPVYFGGMAWQLKKVFDSFLTLRPQMKNKIGAAFTTSGHHSGGKETTLINIIQSLLIYGMIIIGDPYESGGHYGAACIGNPNEHHKQEARSLGKRVAETVKSFKSAKIQTAV